MADVIPALHLGGEEATKELLDMCAPTPETRVLDIGCGSGHTACEVARVYGSRVTGITELIIDQKTGILVPAILPMWFPSAS